MLVGEIGINRREFLYELQFWETLRIIAGYRRRHILHYQLQRLTAYSAFYSMRDNKSGKTPQQWLPLDFDHEDEDSDPDDIPTDEEVEQMRQELMEYNRQHGFA